VGEAVRIARAFHLALDGIPRDGLAADETRAIGAAAGDRDAAGEEETAVRQSLSHALPQRVGVEIASSRDQTQVAGPRPARAEPGNRRATRRPRQTPDRAARAKTLASLRPQHEQ
jgi:hypothetical protein